VDTIQQLIEQKTPAAQTHISKFTIYKTHIYAVLFLHPTRSVVQVYEWNCHLVVDRDEVFLPMGHLQLNVMLTNKEQGYTTPKLVQALVGFIDVRLVVKQ